MRKNEIKLNGRSSIKTANTYRYMFAEDLLYLFTLNCSYTIECNYLIFFRSYIIYGEIEKRSEYFSILLYSCHNLHLVPKVVNLKFRSRDFTVG